MCSPLEFRIAARRGRGYGSSLVAECGCPWPTELRLSANQRCRRNSQVRYGGKSRRSRLSDVTPVGRRGCQDVKALYFSAHGDVDRLTYGDLPEPVPSAGEALVRVRACALNRLDLWVLEGWPSLKLPMPHIGGADIAGEIAGLGDGCAGWSIGDRVALTPGFVPAGVSDEWITRGEECLSPHYQIFGETCNGGLAELMTAPAHTLLALPPALSFSAAAAPLLVATTAWRMLKGRAHLAAGETVLVVGAAGGLNAFTVVLAKHLGARVIALTGSAEKAEFVRSLGADDVIDYHETPQWGRAVRNLTGKRGVDVVVDNVGRTTFPESLVALARGGRLVTVGNTSGAEVTFDNRLVFGKQLSIIGSTMGSSADSRSAIEFAWGRDPARFIGAELPLSAGREAFRMLKAVEHRGKIVLLP